MPACLLEPPGMLLRLSQVEARLAEQRRRRKTRALRADDLCARVDLPEERLDLTATEGDAAGAYAFKGGEEEATCKACKAVMGMFKGSKLCTEAEQKLFQQLGNDQTMVRCMLSDTKVVAAQSLQVSKSKKKKKHKKQKKNNQSQEKKNQDQKKANPTKQKRSKKKKKKKK